MAVTTQQIGPYNFGYGAGGGWGNWDDRHTADNDTIVLYRFNDACGGAVDSSGNGYDLSEVEGGSNITYSETGEFSDCIKITAGDYLRATAAGLLTDLKNATNATITIEAWVKVVNTATSWQQFVTLGGTGKYLRFMCDNAAQAMLQVNCGGINKEIKAGSTSSAAFQHYAWCMNTTAGEGKFYQNGVQIGATMVGVGTGFGAGDPDNLCVGKLDGTAEPMLNGWIDELAISKVIRY